MNKKEIRDLVIEEVNRILEQRAPVFGDVNAELVFSPKYRKPFTLYELNPDGSKGWIIEDGLSADEAFDLLDSLTNLNAQEIWWLVDEVEMEDSVKLAIK